MSHTPGPWKILGNQHTCTGGFSIISQTVPVLEIAKTFDDSGEDAQLIAAAPELLVALQAWTKYNEDFSSLSWDEVSQMVLSAVAKATGKETP